MAVALVYPNSYYIGMSNLGFQTVYRLLNSYDDIVCERAFYEPKLGEGPLISLETQRPLDDFSVVAFSISYELDYWNALQALKAAGVPLFASQRDDSHPLIIAGGPCLTANPAPLSPVFDAIAIGEGEAILPGLVGALRQGLDREQLLAALAKVPGVYVPSQENGPVQRQYAPDLAEPTTSVVLTPETEFKDMYLMEIARGCGRACRFCLAGYLFRPVRARPLEALLEQAEEGLKHSRRLGLVGAAVSDHPDLDELVSELNRRGAALSFSSLRADALTEPVLEALVASGTKSVALAPEAGSEGLRNAINKGLDEDAILLAVEKLAKRGMRQLKLYFMVGLPAETDEDIAALIDLCLKCKAVADKHQKGSQLSLNISPFVPKAHTPYQWQPMAAGPLLEERLARVKSALRPYGIEVKGESVAWSEVQGVLARGDASLAKALSGMEECSLSAWRRALEERGLSADHYVHRETGRKEALPWDVVDIGLKRAYLGWELGRAEQGLFTKTCAPASCRLCGVC